MIDARMARAIKLFVESGVSPLQGKKPPHLDVHLVTDEGESLVFIEAANQYMAIQITYYDPELEDDMLDVLISFEDIKRIAKLGRDADIAPVDFDEGSSTWKSIESALDSTDRDPAPVGVNLVPNLGVNLALLAAITETLKLLYPTGPKLPVQFVHIAQVSYLHPITLRCETVESNDDWWADIEEVVITLMPLRTIEESTDTEETT
jgi:hypothetical protein